MNIVEENSSYLYHITFFKKMQDNFSENTYRRITHTIQDKKTHFDITHESEITKLLPDIKRGERIFFYGDLGAGKSTYIRQLLRKFSGNDELIVRSPTYTYYSHYSIQGLNIYHFDLYRCEDLDTFLSIGGYEILENPDNICLIEWPQILESEVSPTLVVEIE